MKNNTNKYFQIWNEKKYIAKRFDLKFDSIGLNKVINNILVKYKNINHFLRNQLKWLKNKLLKLAIQSFKCIVVIFS